MFSQVRHREAAYGHTGELGAIHRTSAQTHHQETAMTPDQEKALAGILPDWEYVPATVLHELPDVLDRALQAGARPPLTFLGAGMTAIVLGSHKAAYKVGRRLSDSLIEGLTAEAEWLEIAKRTPGVKEHVVRTRRFFPAPVLVIVNDEVPQVSKSTYGLDLWGLHQRMGALMKAEGWGTPEFKETSYIVGPKGPILVDASVNVRFGKRFLAYVKDILSGKRLWLTERPQDLAWALETEVTDGRLTAKEAEWAIAKLRELS